MKGRKEDKEMTREDAVDILSLKHLFHRSNSIAVYSAAALIFYYDVVCYFKMHNDHMNANVRKCKIL